MKLAMNNQMAKMDMGLFAAILVMLGFGLVLVYSSSFALAQMKFGGADYFLANQAIRAVLAIGCFMIFINVDYHFWGKISKLTYIMAVILLVIVLVDPGSHAVNGARRWISLGFVRFQVSDFGRMALILLVARNCEEAGSEIVKFSYFMKLLVKIGIVCSLILVEPNMSTAVVLGIVCLAMMFLSGAKFTHIISLFLAFIPVAALLILNTPYRRRRLMGYLHGSSGNEAVTYQTFQSLIGLGHGGIFGVGLGKGDQKFFYLPEPHTDFAFSILGEEIGFVGLVIVMSIFAFIIYRGMRAALHAPDKMGQLMAFGFTMVVAMYMLIHAAVGTGMIPTTGIPLPFLSYGGMSLIFMVSSMGIVLNISSQTKFSSVQKRNFHSELAAD
jgi:cell division protein FtsW